MKQLQQKCFLVSAAVHGLLLLVLLVGSAFYSPRNTAKGSAGSGLPTPVIILPPPAQPRPVPAAPSAPASPLAPQAPPHVSDPIQPLAPAGPSANAGLARKRSLPQVNTNFVTRAGPRSARLGPLARNPVENSGVAAFEGAISNLLVSLSPSTPIGDFGADNGAESFSYEQIVKDMYSQYWESPEGDADTTTRVTVTIASSGRVLSARIITPSGDARMDQSVARVLAQVTQLQPFEPGAKDKQRSYTVNFNLKTRKLS